MRHIPIAGLFLLAFLSVVTPTADGNWSKPGHPGRISRIESTVLSLSLCVAAAGIGLHSGQVLAAETSSAAWRKYDALSVLDHAAKRLRPGFETIPTCSMVPAAEQPEAEPWRDRSAPGRSRRDSPALPRNC